MIDSLSASLQISASGLRAQAERMRVVSENLANSQSTGSSAGAEPYQRKTISFEAEVAKASDAELVKVGRIGRDRTPFPIEHRPGHPAADASGYVKLPNVRPLVELADLREANRSYEANLQVIRQIRQIQSMTIDLLRSS
ncbi:MAG: flagellar basal body rod protein FlgC [Rhodobacteraceae bacterium]|nr:flagellar basal body rod protein FlgC [Paracoccaceae bacterium]